MGLDPRILTFGVGLIRSIIGFVQIGKDTFLALASLHFLGVPLYLWFLTSQVGDQIFDGTAVA